MTPIYRNVKSYQVLQRQWDTNTAWVEDAQGQHHELSANGGPYTIDGAQHVIVGDLWLLAGQSNMRGFGFFDASGTHGVHCFQSNEVWGNVPPSRPIHQLATSPRAIHHTLPDPTVRDPDLALERGASLVPEFAERYRQELGVPIGVVPCAHGGVTLGQWASDGGLYGAMMDKIELVGGRFTGVLWYQGESDAVDLDLARQYQQAWTQWIDRFDRDTTMMDRKPLFVYAQIARMVTDGSPDLDLAWNLVRKAQLDVFLQQRQRLRLAMVPTLDADMDDFIHLSAKGLQTVGRRMADAAIALIRQQEAPVLYVTTATMVHISYNKGKSTLHLLRLGFNQPAPDFDASPSPTAFTIHDTQTSARLDMIYSARLSLDGHLDLYLTEKGYQQLAAAANGRYALWYGYGRNPLPGNLVTTSDVALLACGPLPIVIAPTRN